MRAVGKTPTGEDIRAGKTAALVHDIEHSPFSHALEGILADRNHEEWTVDIITSYRIMSATLFGMVGSIFRICQAVSDPVRSVAGQRMIRYRVYIPDEACRMELADRSK